MLKDKLAGNYTWQYEMAILLGFSFHFLIYFYLGLDYLS